MGKDLSADFAFVGQPESAEEKAQRRAELTGRTVYLCGCPDQGPKLNDTGLRNGSAPPHSETTTLISARVRGTQKKGLLNPPQNIKTGVVFEPGEIYMFGGCLIWGGVGLYMLGGFQSPLF